MKEYKCSIVMDSCEGSTASSMMILNENDLEFLNKIATALPFHTGSYDRIEFGVILLPDPIPDDIDSWFWNTPYNEIQFIISSVSPNVYEEFKKEGEKLMDTSFDEMNFLTKFYTTNKNCENFNELFKDLLYKLGHMKHEMTITNKKHLRFLGVYEFDKLPNAGPGDIIQIRVPIGERVTDGFAHILNDKDLVIMNDNGYWTRFDKRDDLADEDNIYIMCIGSPARIVSNTFDMEPKNLRALNAVVNAFDSIKIVVVKISTGKIIMNSSDHSVFDKYLKTLKS